ncbi:MAG: hypothetical protein B7C24_02150 [Bacteroidetes bacterium 4572_77]|nr:MAG: hypothetical protein B7C24_02150 [Bacteroidetes bacterium 4572_77]
MSPKNTAMILSNYHTHTIYSDGKESLDNTIKKAISLGFHSLGISDHAPVLFPSNYSIKTEKFDAYIAEINQLKKHYKSQIDIYLSIEADYIPNHTYTFSYFREKATFDYIIGSVHMVYHPQTNKMWFIDGGKQEIWDKGLQEVFDGQIKKAVNLFYQQSMEMIEEQKPEVIGHLDKIKMHNKERFFSVNDKWYKALIEETLSLVKKNNQLLEINTRGWYKGRCKELFPSIPVILQAQKMGIPLILSSDAHHPDELNAHFNQSLSLLKNVGVGELYEFRAGVWKAALL